MAVPDPIGLVEAADTVAVLGAAATVIEAVDTAEVDSIGAETADPIGPVEMTKQRRAVKDQFVLRLQLGHELHAPCDRCEYDARHTGPARSRALL